MGRESKNCYEILLLDVDGTLLDFNRSEREGVSLILRKYGFPASDLLLSRYHQINARFWEAFERGEISKEKLSVERFAVFFGELGRETDGQKEEAVYREFLDHSAFLFPEALKTCRYLSEKYACYIVTNGTSKTQYTRLAISGLDVLVKDIFVSEEAGSQKPQKEYFDYCFSRIFPELEGDPDRERKLDACKRKVLITGDSLYSDILGGNLAGIDTCWVNPEGKALRDGIHADYVIKEISELRKLL